MGPVALAFSLSTKAYIASTDSWLQWGYDSLFKHNMVFVFLACENCCCEIKIM